MKQLFAFLFLIITFSCNHHKKEQLLPLHNKKVLILGNSITQDGRYIDFIEYYLRKQYPQENLNIISVGLSGETASGDSEKKHPFSRPWVHNRLDNALSFTKPDLVLACYGINDGIYSELDSTRFSNYKKGILRIKDKVEASGANIMFLSPTPFEASSKKVYNNLEKYSYKRPYAKYNEVIEAYTRWLKTIEDVQVIDLHTYLTKVQLELKNRIPEFTLIPDAVHPNEMGHFFMAKKILNDLYPDISLNIDYSEVKNLKKDTLFNLVSKRRAIRSNGWLRYIGYVRRDTVKLQDISPTVKHVNDLEQKINELLSSQTLKN